MASDVYFNLRMLFLHVCTIPQKPVFVTVLGKVLLI